MKRDSHLHGNYRVCDPPEGEVIKHPADCTILPSGGANKGISYDNLIDTCLEGNIVDSGGATRIEFNDILH